MPEMTYAQAGLAAVTEEMRRDPTIFYLTTDTIASLVKEFGPMRTRPTPIAESAVTGMAIGAAGSGMRPICDWRQVTFCFVAMDQIVNQAAKIHYMFGGQAKFPVTFRATVGGGTQLAAQHSQSPYSMFMNLAGLKMILPSTPADMKGLLKSAICDNNPVISFEANRLLTMRGEVPDGDYTVPLGVADVKRQGRDCTVVALAWMVHEALAAAETLSHENISVEVVDPRTRCRWTARHPRLGAQDRSARRRRRGRANLRRRGGNLRARDRGCTDLPRTQSAGPSRVCAGGGYLMRRCWKPTCFRTATASRLPCARR